MKNIYKLKSYNGKVIRNFHNNKIPKEGSQCICLLVVSVFRTGQNYNPQLFLEKCKYVAKEKKMAVDITVDIETYYDDSDRENSGEENRKLWRRKLCIE